MIEAVLSLALWSAVPPASLAEDPDADAGAPLHALSVSSRAARLAALNLSDRATALRAISAQQWIALGRRAVDELGTYRMKLRKTERVDGDIQEEQTYDVWVRETPRAVRAKVVHGPGTGREIQYDETVRANQMKVTEPGLLGVAGGFWVDVKGTLARRESNHSVADLSLGAMLSLMSTNFARAEPFGGYHREVLGFDSRGLWCLRFHAPAGASGLYATVSRVCVQPETGWPLEVENEDDKGFLERFVVSGVTPKDPAVVSTRLMIR